MGYLLLDNDVEEDTVEKLELRNQGLIYSRETGIVFFRGEEIMRALHETKKRKL